MIQFLAIIMIYEIIIINNRNYEDVLKYILLKFFMLEIN